VHKHHIRLHIQIGYACPFAFVEMAVRNMLQQIAEGENLQFFFQQIGTKRPYPFQVFNGIG
jgi:hypothetical protein